MRLWVMAEDLVVHSSLLEIREDGCLVLKAVCEEPLLPRGHLTVPVTGYAESVSINGTATSLMPGFCFFGTEVSSFEGDGGRMVTAIVDLIPNRFALYLRFCRLFFRASFYGDVVKISRYKEKMNEQ